MLAVATGFCLADVTRPAERQWTARLALAGIAAYQAHGAPVLGAVGVTCRFVPTCSRYARAAIERDGLIVGGWRALRRLARCGPWTQAGTRDPVAPVP